MSSILESILKKNPVNEKGVYFSWYLNECFKLANNENVPADKFSVLVTWGLLVKFNYTVQDKDLIFNQIPIFMDNIKKHYMDGVTGYHGTFDSSVEFHLDSVLSEFNDIDASISKGRTFKLKDFTIFPVMTDVEKEIFSLLKEENDLYEKMLKIRWKREDLQDSNGYTVTENTKTCYEECEYNNVKSNNL